jgi:hypothetical protein
LSEIPIQLFANPNLLNSTIKSFCDAHRCDEAAKQGQLSLQKSHEGEDIFHEPLRPNKVAAADDRDGEKFEARVARQHSKELSAIVPA